jgi:cytochrome P450
MFGADFIANPYPAYARLREAAPVHWMPEFGSGAWLIPRYQDVVRSLQEPRLSAKRSHRFVAQYSPEQQVEFSDFNSHFAKWLVFLDPPRHSVWRRLINKGFSPAMLNEARSSVAALANHLIDRVFPAGKMDFIKDYAYAVPAMTMVALLGVPPADHNAVIGWTDDIAKFFGNARSPLDVAQTAREALFALSDYFVRMLQARRERPEKDLVSLLLQAEEADDQVTPEELAAQCSALLFAGHETTRNLLGNGLLALLMNPEQMELLRGDRSLIPSAVKEMARFDTPAQLGSRVVAESFELHGHELKEGQIVIAMFGSANRDPTTFAEPDHFNITRKGPPSVAFGKGAHYCVGSLLATLEAEVTLATILDRMPNVRLGKGELKWVNNINFRGLQSLPVEF